MRLIIDIIVLALKILIKIGDFVLSAGSLLGKTINNNSLPQFPYSKKRLPKQIKIHSIYPSPKTPLYKAFLASQKIKNHMISTLLTVKSKLNILTVKTAGIFKKSVSAVITILSFCRNLLKTVLGYLLKSANHTIKSFWDTTKKIFSVGKKKKNKKILVRKSKEKNRSKPALSFPFLSKFRYFLAGTVFSCIVIFLPLLFYIFIQELPNPNQLSLRHIPQTTKIYDRHGILLYQIYAAQNRTLVPLSRIPKHLKQATIAVEDKDFYTHPGFDAKAILRSAIENLSGRGLQGGSTITQQLIKSALLTSETSLQRKIKELVLALWAEQVYSKDEILEMYFNQVPYGGTAWGVEAASEVYFGKKVEALSLPESAFLAGIPRAPTIYSPFGETPNAWKKRQKEVLSRMVKLGYITSKEEKEAASQRLTFQTPQTPLHAPYFVMYVRDFLVRKYGISTVERGGLSITTSLDLKLNDTAQTIVSEEVEKYAYLNLTNGAAVITNPLTGDILAMIGGKDYSQEESGKVNVATSLRQPGSSIKVVTYAAALSRGFTAATILDDSPITYKLDNSSSYTPVNYDGSFHGKMPLRIALANSYNIPAVKTLQAIGVPTMIQVGRNMGIKNWNDESRYGLSLTLGGGEVTMLDMATVYGTLANRGERVDLNPILKIVDSKGTILEEKRETTKRRILDEGSTYILSDILADNNARSREFGTNSLLHIPGYTIPVKTGTSDNKRDNWAIGYTPSYVITVWVGNNDNSPMSQYLASGITGAAPIWNRLMTTVLQDKKDEKQQIPQSVVQKPCLGRMEYFIAGTENSVPCRPFAFPLLSPTRTP